MLVYCNGVRGWTSGVACSSQEGQFDISIQAQSGGGEVKGHGLLHHSPVLNAGTLCAPA